VTSYTHALSNPEELLRRNDFYVVASAQSEAILRVYEAAKSKDSSQFNSAEEVADTIAMSPPATDSHASLANYVRDMVLSSVPLRMRYDDVFWSCLLYLLDHKEVPFCAIGGPFHKMIYKIYDDFDPNDVSG